MSDQIAPIPKPLVVRCVDRMIFKISRTTGEAISCSVYDPYCYSDPDLNVEYMEHTDWLKLKEKQNDLR